MRSLRGVLLLVMVALCSAACGTVSSDEAMVDAAPATDGPDTPGPDASDPTAPDAGDPEVVGELTTALLPLLNPPSPEQASGESSMGLVVADSQLAATSAADRGAAVMAFMNPGGIRSGLDVGPVTRTEVARVQPFRNTLTTFTLTGAQIERLLEQQWQPGFTRILQPSAGFTYTWKVSATSDRIDPASIKLDGVVIDPVRRYRVTANDFIATGGDGYAVFAEGTDRVSGAIDSDALIAYLQANRPLGAPTTARISTVP